MFYQNEWERIRIPEFINLIFNFIEKSVGYYPVIFHTAKSEHLTILKVE